MILLADFPGLRISGLRPSEIGGAIGLRLGGGAEAKAFAEILQRALEIVIAACLLVAALPALVAASAAIWAVDPGPVLYRQKREGLGGRQINLFKLRTMYQDADKRLEALLLADAQAREEWSTHFKLRDDPRILPRIGSFLRKTSLDELPQLFNVLAGEMRARRPAPAAGLSPRGHGRAVPSRAPLGHAGHDWPLADLRAQRCGRFATAAIRRILP